MPMCTIVGMGPGVGFAVARRFGREGFAIAMVARRASELERFAADLEKEGIAARGIAANAVDTFALAQAMAEIEKQAGSIDVLVYNAAAVRQAPPTRKSATRSSGARAVGGAWRTAAAL